MSAQDVVTLPGSTVAMVRDCLRRGSAGHSELAQQSARALRELNTFAAMSRALQDNPDARAVLDGGMAWDLRGGCALRIFDANGTSAAHLYVPPFGDRMLDHARAAAIAQVIAEELGLLEMA